MREILGVKSAWGLSAHRLRLLLLPPARKRANMMLDCAVKQCKFLTDEKSPVMQ